jgi:hypothetical protein
MAKLNPDEERRAELFRGELIRKIEAYCILRDSSKTKKYQEYADKVEKMLITGKYEQKDIHEAITYESLAFERFATVDRAFNEANALAHTYDMVFPEDKMTDLLKDALQDMRSTHSIGLSTIIRIFEDRTEQLLNEIIK